MRKGLDEGSESIPRVVLFNTLEEPAYLWYGLSASYYGCIKITWTSYSNAVGIEGISSRLLSWGKMEH